MKPPVKKGLRGLDPRPKLLLMASASTAALLAHNPRFQALVLGFLLLTLLFGGADMRLAWRRLRLAVPLVFFLFVVQTLFYSAPGESAPLFLIGDFGFASAEGLRFAALLSLRLLAVVLSALVLIEGDLRDYLLALTQLKLPYEFAFMVLAAVHFLPVLREEAHAVWSGAQLRGLDFKKLRLPAKIRACLFLCLPIFAGALRRAEELSIAMDIRGFRANPTRSSMRRLTLRKRDWLFLFLWPALIAALYALSA